jgi:hypothetical protein
MRQLKKQLCTGRLFPIELSAVIFAPFFIAPFYPRGKANGIMLKETNYAW